jgi:hypothetical protein
MRAEDKNEWSYTSKDGESNHSPQCLEVCKEQLLRPANRRGLCIACSDTAVPAGWYRGARQSFVISEDTCTNVFMDRLRTRVHMNTSNNGNNNNVTTQQMAQATDQGVLCFYSSTHFYRMCPNVISFILIRKDRPSLSRSARHSQCLASIMCSFIEIRQQMCILHADVHARSSVQCQCHCHESHDASTNFCKELPCRMSVKTCQTV